MLAADTHAAFALASAPSVLSDHSDGSLLPLPMDADGLAAAAPDRHGVGAPPADAGQPRRALFITTRGHRYDLRPRALRTSKHRKKGAAITSRGLAATWYSTRALVVKSRDIDLSLGWRFLSFAGLLTRLLDGRSACMLCHGVVAFST